MEKSYDEVISELENMKTLSHSKRQSTHIYSSDLRVFFIRGTRFFIEIKRQTNWLSRIKRFNETVLISWYFKTKKFRKKKEVVSFEDLLESPLLSEKAKAELLFNIDLFRS